jgi:SAM-dependent methyltransferase
MTKPSISFDRAAGYYDETRITDPTSLRTIIDLLEARLPGRGPVLEIGVGTGQLALPLARRGVPVTGLDLSAEMLAVLRSKAADEPPMPLIRADATRLPFPSGSIGGAYARWVLHLIPDWIGVLRELDRTVVPGGTVAIEPGGFSGPFRETYLRFLEILGDAVVTVGLTAVDRDEQLDEGFAGVGWVLEDEVPVLYEGSRTLQEVFDDIPAKRWSWTWRVPDEDLARATGEVRSWAQERFGDLRRTIPPEATRWRVYRRAV